MTSLEILEALEALLGYEPEDGNLMFEGRDDHARLSISHKAATAILERLQAA